MSQKYCSVDSILEICAVKHKNEIENRKMKHFLTYIDEAIKSYWNEPALTNYCSNTLTYGDVAAGIERYHLVFEKCGIAKGEKIALCAKNSAEWCVA